MNTDSCESAYTAGQNSKPFDKNPHQYGTPEFMEWNYGRVDAHVFDEALQLGHPKLARVLSITLVALLLLLGWDFIWL